MSPMAFLALTTLALGAYLFLLLREYLYNQKSRKYYLVCGSVVLSEVKNHFAELKDKQLFLVEDKGYGVVDESKWLKEVDNFISLILGPEINSRIGNQVSTLQYKDFIKKMIFHLILEDVVSPEFSVEQYVDSVKCHKTSAADMLVIFSWVFSACFIAIGLYIATKHAWVSAALILLAGGILNPYLYDKFTQRAHWLSHFNIGPWLAFTIAVLSTSSYFQHSQANLVSERAKMVETEKQQRIVQQRLVDQRRAELDRQREVAEEQVKSTFVTRKSEILEQLNSAIQQERFSDALTIISKNSVIIDKELSELRDEYNIKKFAYENREAKEKEERERQDNYAKRIRSYAIDKYTSAQYPKTVAQYRSRLPEIEKLRRSAAEQAVDSGKCDYVENVQITQESSLKALKFFIDCSNENRIYLNEAEIKSGATIRTEAEKAWNEGDAIRSCRELVKKNATIPSSVDFHSVTGTHAFTIKSTGIVQVNINFDAKNAFGTEIGYSARCIFEPGRVGEIEIFLRH